MRRPTASCTGRADALPGCDTGPAGRLGFVIREARAAWRRHRVLRTSTDRPDLPQGGTR